VQKWLGLCEWSLLYADWYNSVKFLWGIHYHNYETIKAVMLIP
jgi:hypothetical protein